MNKIEEFPKKHSPRWLLNKIKTSKHDGESLMTILEFQKVIGEDAVKSRVNAISDEMEDIKIYDLDERKYNEARNDGIEDCKQLLKQLI